MGRRGIGVERSLRRHSRRRQHRGNKELRSLYDDALRLYRTRILENVDLDRLPDLRSRAAVAARAMIDRGDARAFAMGRQMLGRVDALAR
jgi:hypothetical protein